MRITFKGNGVVWDTEKKRNLCKFKSVGYIEGVYQTGEFTTDDTRTIELLKDYPTVPADAMKYYWEEKEGKGQTETDDNFEDYSVAELKSFAKNKNINLRDAKKKADIIVLLRG